MHIFSELGDNGFSSCTVVVGVRRRKWGRFGHHATWIKPHQLVQFCCVVLVFYSLGPPPVAGRQWLSLGSVLGEEYDD